MPPRSWLPAYDPSFLRFDVIAGATIWGLLVPESIAYAGLVGLPPQAGLYTLLATLGAYAVFGTSRHLVAGATSAAAVLLASFVCGLAHGAGAYAADAAMLVLGCGAMSLAETSSLRAHVLMPVARHTGAVIGVLHAARFPRR